MNTSQLLRSMISAVPVLAGVLLSPVAAAADDPVMEWNQVALSATVTAGQGPLPQIRTMAIVHVAIHDAVNAITCDYRTYIAIRCGCRGTPEAAAIGAAHRALVNLLPSQAATLNVRRSRKRAATSIS